MEQHRVSLEELAQAAKDNAAAASHNAAAASLNAQALINAERPWLVIEVHREETAAAGSFFFRVMNKGRTPAEFISGDATYSFQTPPTFPPPILPGSAPFNKPDETLIVQDNGFEIYRNGVKPYAQIARVRQEDNLTLFYYGRIVYRDVIAGGITTHETCWCYAFMTQLDEFIATGPEGYNQHT
jgi:hypothetical protein